MLDLTVKILTLTWLFLQISFLLYRIIKKLPHNKKLILKIAVLNLITVILFGAYKTYLSYFWFEVMTVLTLVSFSYFQVDIVIAEMRRTFKQAVRPEKE